MEQKTATSFFVAWTGWALAIALECWPCLVMAQDLESAREQFDLGREAFIAGEYQLAIEHFQQAHQSQPNVRLLLYIGQCYSALEDDEAAADFIGQFAITSENCELAVDHYERIEATYDDARLVIRPSLDACYEIAVERAMRAVDTYLNPGPSGDPPFIRFTSTPAGADVYVDDLTLGSLGQTPLAVPIFSGDHVVFFVLPYHETVQVEITTPMMWRPDTGVDVQLTRRTANVDITFEPTTANVTYFSEDGVVVDLGTGSYTGELPAGDGIFVLEVDEQKRRIVQTLTGEEAIECFTLQF